MNLLSLNEKSFSELCNDIMSEARKPSGTWSLATHRRLSDALALFTSEYVEKFVEIIISRMIDPDTAEGEIFKLTQLCTMMHQKRVPRIVQLWERYKDKLDLVKQRNKETSLGQTINRLISSLYIAGTTPMRHAVTSASPPPSLGVAMGITYKPTPICVTAKRVMYARTPVPRI